MSQLVKREANEQALGTEPTSKHLKTEERIVAPAALFSYVKKERQPAGILYKDAVMLQDFGEFKRGERFDGVSMRMGLIAWRGGDDFETDAPL